MKRKKHSVPRILTIVLFVTISVSAFCDSFSALEFDVPTVRFSALGGRHAALGDDFETLFSNPAGFVKAEPSLSVSRIGVGMSGPVFTLAGIVLKNMNSGGDIQALLSESAYLKELLKSG